MHFHVKAATGKQNGGQNNDKSASLPSTHPTMEPINISRDGVYKLIKNINPSKATGPDTIAGRVLNTEILIYVQTSSHYYSPNHWKQAKYHLTGTTQMSRLYSKKEINTTQVHVATDLYP